MDVRGSWNSPDTREVVLGSGSRVWSVLEREGLLAERFTVAISHRDLDVFSFQPQDRVWVLSYSRVPRENARLLRRLANCGIREIVYVSSSSTIVGQVTDCYEYPRVKLEAEIAALAWPRSKVLTIGLMYSDERSLPGGDNVATSFRELAAFMMSPRWPDAGGRRKFLFGRVVRPFRGPVEAWLHSGYGRLMRLLTKRPCLLRPIDLVLRALGMRWYGYVFLSNRLWTSTTS